MILDLELLNNLEHLWHWIRLFINTHNPTPKKKLIFFRYHDRWKLVTGNYFISLGWIWNLWCLENWWLSLLNNLRMETTMSHRMLTRELQEFNSMIPYDSTLTHIFILATKNKDDFLEICLVVFFYNFVVG